MEEFKTEFQLIELLNKAIKYRNNHDLDNFNNTIKEIDTIAYHNKYQFMKFLFEDEFRWMLDPGFPGYTENNKEIPTDFEKTYDILEVEWTEVFILNDLNYSKDGVDSLDLLETLMWLGKSHDDSFYQNIVSEILKKIDIETDEIYYVRDFLLRKMPSSNFIPDCFKLKENEVLPKLIKLPYYEPAFKFIQNENGEVCYEIHPEYYGPVLNEYDAANVISYENERIEENLKLIPENNTLKSDFLNCKAFF